MTLTHEHDSRPAARPRAHSERPAISVVVPVYREEHAIAPFLARMQPVLRSLTDQYEIVFCLDPCTDGTERAILNAIAEDPRIRLLVFSRRFGQPAATLAGLRYCSGEACLVIDVDLQDPPELLAEMYARLREGYEVVFARRRSRDGETRLKLVESALGYRLMRRWASIPIPVDAGDFRLVTRRVIDQVNRLEESTGYLRGMVAYVGFRQTFIDYDRQARHHGESKYGPWLGSVNIGLDGLLGFSRKPLQLAWWAGTALLGLSAVSAAWWWVTPPQSAVAPAVATFGALFCGLQLLATGLLGEYVGRMYDEVRRRPAFIVDRFVNFDDEAGAPAEACHRAGPTA